MALSIKPSHGHGLDHGQSCQLPNIFFFKKPCRWLRASQTANMYVQRQKRPNATTLKRHLFQSIQPLAFAAIGKRASGSPLHGTRWMLSSPLLARRKGVKDTLLMGCKGRRKRRRRRRRKRRRRRTRKRRRRRTRKRRRRRRTRWWSRRHVCA